MWQPRAPSINTTYLHIILQLIQVKIIRTTQRNSYSFILLVFTKAPLWRHLSCILESKLPYRFITSSDASLCMAAVQMLASLLPFQRSGNFHSRINDRWHHHTQCLPITLSLVCFAAIRTNNERQTRNQQRQRRQHQSQY